MLPDTSVSASVRGRGDPEPGWARDLYFDTKNQRSKIIKVPLEFSTYFFIFYILNYILFSC